MRRVLVFVFFVLLIIFIFSVAITLSPTGFFALQKEPVMVEKTQNTLATPHLADPNNLEPSPEPLVIQKIDGNSLK